MLFIKPQNLELPIAYHKSLWKNNSDGVSIYNLDCNELYQSLDFNDVYDYLINNASDEMIVHYRFGTSGLKSKEQLHGWIVAENYHFFHNGVLKTFKGDEKQSDTQQLVKYFNENNFDLYEIVNYLEKQEQSSRFLLVNKDTNEIVKPNCAKWNDPTIFNDGHEIVFSNTYAIDYHLLKQDNDFDYSNFDSDFNYLDEVEFIVKNSSIKELTDFVIENPDLIADYLKSYF